MFTRFNSELKTMLASGRTMEESLAQLRSQGASPIECIAAIKEVRGCDLSEAKRLVHSSRAWHDVASATEKMWDELIDDFENEKKA